MPYKQPVGFHRTYTTVSNSRFICTINRVVSTTDAKETLAQVRAEMPDANHHAYAFRVGYGNSVVEGISDDGEPSGTAGPPLLAIVRGSDIGDIIVIVTRYFGGTKLGTGGLVRAYSEAARTALDSLVTELNIPKKMIGIEAPYPIYEVIKRLILQYDGLIQDETFTTDVSIIIEMPLDYVPAFSHDLTELTGGRLSPIFFD